MLFLLVRLIISRAKVLIYYTIIRRKNIAKGGR
jgi:hypothetical protein